MAAILLVLLQIIVASGILYGYYHFFLRNKQFHQYNRFYLLAIVVISLLIPFLQIPIYFTSQETAPSMVMRTLETIYSSGGEGDGVIVNGTAQPSGSLDWQSFLYVGYVIVGMIFLIRMMASLAKIRSLVRENPVEKLDDIIFVKTEEPGTPFSFFRWLFWDNRIELQSSKGEQIFRHEIYHIQQRHSWDLVFMEIVTTICWVNPFFHLMKKELKTIHEFLADQFAVKETEKWNYAELLLMQALHTRQPLVNPFFHNQIKRRIAMITNPKRTSHRYLRKLLVLPVAAVVVTLFAFKYKHQEQPITIQLSDRQLTIVVDPGHGGMDPGTIEPGKKHSEADIALDISQAIRDLAPEYNVRVVLTRDADVLPGGAANKEDGLKMRLQIADQSKPDAYISIHVNSAGSGKFQDGNSGFEAFIAQRNAPINRELASSILQRLQPVYKTDQQIRLRKQESIYVLDENKFPSVMLQCGFINNEKDLAFILDRSNQLKIARGILEGVRAKFNIQKVNDEEVHFQELRLTDTVPAEKIVIGYPRKTLQLDSVKTVEGVRILSKSVKPLFMVDGKEVPASEVEKLDPNRIREVTIKKDAKAVEVYGYRAKEGVVEITTQNGEKLTGLVKELKGEPLAGLVKEVRIDEESPAPPLNEVVVVGYGTSAKRDLVYDDVENKPEFPGGASAWQKYLERNLNVNDVFKNGAPLGKYYVVVQFFVDKEGNIKDVKALTHIGYGMEDEAVRVIRNGPKWVPGTNKGQNVNAYRRQPIMFMLIPDKETLILEKSKPTVSESVTVTGKLRTNTENLPKIFPNPSNQDVNLEMTSENGGDAEIQVADQTGQVKLYKKVQLTKGKNNLKLNTGGLSNGTYIVTIFEEKDKNLHTYSYKLIKQ